MKAQVLVEVNYKSLDQTFTYNIKDDMKVEVGCRVLVPFGNKMVEGFVLEIGNFEVTYDVKDIYEVIDTKPVLNNELLKLGKYISGKTMCNLISAYQTMLPSALKAKNNFKINKKYETYIMLDMEYEKALSLCKNDTQKQIVTSLKEGMIKKVSSSSVNTLLKNKIIKEELKEVYRLKEDEIEEDIKPTLTIEQSNAIKEITKNDGYKTFLLHGVTGSGKTEVYMRVLESVIKKGKSAILLVPEISLTPQIVTRFRKRFKNDIAILHSGLSNGEKYDEWRKIESGKVKIVIGARSAIFAPLNNLGVIIVDEEHSTTYKQENTPKYDAKDIANVRGKYNNIPVILGSATPSIESYTKAKIGNYKLITMKKRVNENLPLVHLVNMKDEIKNGNSIISSILKEKIIDRLNKKEQVIILLNKRGYTRIITCPNCGYQDTCPNCDIPLTYHKTSNVMRCHYCGYAKKKLEKCPECSCELFKESGIGTEKLEEIIKEEFNCNVIRMDIDTTTKKGSHEKLIKMFENKEADILIGTQMISKGLDFENVTLVGVLNGDSSLNIPDFRSAERTFQLLSQVSGRSGRSKFGEVVIQGFNMEHYSIMYAKNHDYESFYNEEMKLRRILKYSPYYNLTLIKLKGKDINELFKEGYKVANYINDFKLKDTYVLGPSTAMIPKINNIFTVQLIIKYKNSEDVIMVLKKLQAMYLKNKITLDIDINPIQL